MNNAKASFSPSTLTKPVLLEGGEIWDAKKGDFKKLNIILDDGKIERLFSDKEESFSGTRISIKGAKIFPGFFDMHVHFREPGREDEETVETGARAAIAGGFTGVCPMPNTQPSIDNHEMIRFILDRGEATMVDVYPIGAITEEQEGKKLAEIGGMIKAGAVAISDDGNFVMLSDVARLAFEYAKMYDIPLISHAEEKNLASGGSIHEGIYSTKLGIPGIPSIAEDIAVMRDISISEYTGGKLHVAHISTKGALEAVHRAKEKGIPVTCEATPHHFTLNHQMVETYDPNYKMAPPLRTEEDVEAVITGLKDGTIDAIATDHAPPFTGRKGNGI